MIPMVHDPEDLARLAQDQSVRDWTAAGLLQADQARALRAEIGASLKAASIFLRLTLFVLTGAAIGLLRSGLMAGDVQPGPIDVVFAGLLVGLAEWLVHRHRWHGYGVEEAVLAGAVVLFIVGIFPSGGLFPGGNARQVVAWMAGAGLAAGLAVRFCRVGLLVAGFGCLAAAVTPLSLPELPERAWCAVVAVLMIGAVEGTPGERWLSRANREALRGWGAVVLYVVCNVAIVGAFSGSSFFLGRYDAMGRWTCFVLTLALPPAYLTLALLRRSRMWLRLGLLGGAISIASIKPYLGMVRHDWDPILFGVFLAAAAWLANRWLEAGPEGRRDGYTARDPRHASGGPELAALASVATGLPGAHAPGHAGPVDRPPATGGRFGGGGASGEF